MLTKTLFDDEEKKFNKFYWDSFTSLLISFSHKKHR